MLTEYSWPRDALYKIHLDLHCPDWDSSILSNFDVNTTVSTIASTGTKVMYFFSKDCYGNAYYPTQIGRRHHNIGSRDLLGEVVNEASRQEMLVVAYSVCWDNFAADEHPEWRMRYADGTPASDVVSTDGQPRWKYLCQNSPFVDYMCGMLAEVSKNYDVSGFHIDMLNMDFGRATCYCDYCRDEFWTATGKDLPLDLTWDRVWLEFLEFRFQSVERFATKMRNAIHQHRPGLPISLNYHASPGFDWRTGQQPVRHSRLSDIGTAETYTPMFGSMYPGMATRFVRNLVPDRPYEVVPWRMNRITDFTLKPTTQLRWEVLSALSSGARIMLIDQPFHDGTLDFEAYSLIGSIFQEVEEKRSSFSGDFVKQVGIYYSAKTRDFYGRLDQRQFLLPVQGAFKALIESHFLIDFVFDETADEAILNKFPIVFLPNVAAISAAEARALRSYVNAGGTLIATGETSLFDEYGCKLDDFQLRDVFGVSWKEQIDLDTYYIRGFSSPLGDGIDPRQFILNRGRAQRVLAETAQADGDLYSAFHKRVPGEKFFSHNMHPPFSRETDAAFVNYFGSGIAIYIPYTLDGSYADEYEQLEHRTLIHNCLRFCRYQSPIQVLKAPLNVEIELREQADRYCLHLLAFHPTRQCTSLPRLDWPMRPSVRMDEPMLYEAEIRINVPFSKLEVWDSDTTYEVHGATVKLVCQNVHETLTVWKTTAGS